MKKEGMGLAPFRKHTNKLGAEGVFMSTMIRSALLLSLSTCSLTFACFDLGVPLKTGDLFRGLRIETTAKGFSVRRGKKTFSFSPKFTSKGLTWCYTEGRNEEVCLQMSGRYMEGYQTLASIVDEDGDKLEARVFNQDGRTKVTLVSNPDPEDPKASFGVGYLSFDYGFSAKDAKGNPVQPKFATNDKTVFEKKNGKEGQELHHELKVSLKENQINRAAGNFKPQDLGTLELQKKEIADGMTERSLPSRASVADLTAGSWQGVADDEGCQTKVEPAKKVAQENSESRREEAQEILNYLSRPRTSGRSAPSGGQSGRGITRKSGRGVTH